MSSNDKGKTKIGHRRVSQEGTVTYKKKPTSELQKAIQLGISVSISSTQRKPVRDVLMKDFREVELFDFPKDGSSNLPAHKMSDFKFISFAPIAFRFFRNVYKVEITDFMNSICVHDLTELSNPGASGSVFYITADDEFIIKTVQHEEADFLQKLLPEYFMNLTQHPRTLLPKFYGLYCYQSLGKNIRIVVMNNLIPSSIKVHEKYDLKGSTFKRSASNKEKAKKSPTLKDLDFRELHPNGLTLDPDMYDALVSTIDRDCRDAIEIIFPVRIQIVLESFGIMDYSLLLAIHNLDEARREKNFNGGSFSSPVTSPPFSCTYSHPVPLYIDPIQEECVTPKATQPPTGDDVAPHPHSHSHAHHHPHESAEEQEERRKRAQAAWTRTAKRIAAFSTALESIQATPKVTTDHLDSDEAGSVPRPSADSRFTFDDEASPGGIPARNAKGERLLLFLGIIDILQNYRAIKKLEHAFKSIVHDGNTISVHHPNFYGTRFRQFICQFVMHKASNPNGESSTTPLSSPFSSTFRR